MQQSYAAVLCVLAVLGLEAAAPGECELTRLLQDKLQYEMRLQYMKHYFPINYTVQVQYEEVLRPSNITRLRNGTVSEAALRYLWFHVSSQAVLRIREVLPEKHPSWKYTQELCQLFDALGKEYSKYRQTDVEDVVADLVKLVYSVGAESRRKPVRPKALLDNCLKVGGSPPNAAEGSSLDAFSLPWSLGCCLCSALPLEGGGGRSPRKVQRRVGGQIPPPSRTKRHPHRDCAWPRGQPRPKCQAPSAWVRAGGARVQPPPRAGSCWGVTLPCPARSGGEGIAPLLSVCIFSSAFIKHPLIL
ncbi:interleukin-34 isoform X2 [Tyto alba]|uniref:interleukin-34 isoform X2 n=1 Tax=Tyto alba TaxID=56313 RepID=UPI001C6824CC|nr:interleukin-34 isoform X2 [Tyto alba]